MTITVADSANLFGEQCGASVTIDRDALADMLAAYLSKLTLKEFVELLTNEYDAIVQYASLFTGENTGQKISLMFNPHRLDTRNKASQVSIYGALSELPSFASGLARATLFKKGKVSELLYQTIQLHINGAGYVNEFPPHLARDLARNHGLQITSRVLDPCGGWGGRMIGTSVVCNSYTCCEPQPDTARGLLLLRDFINTYRPEFHGNVHRLPFEDFQPVAGTYDYALTSPPYYDTELYGDDEMQSCVRYTSFDAWCRGFYAPLVHNTMLALKPGSPFIVNIGSRKYPLAQALHDICGTAYTVDDLGNLLGGKAGLKSGKVDGERFFRIRKANANT